MDEEITQSNGTPRLELRAPVQQLQPGGFSLSFWDSLRGIQASAYQWCQTPGRTQLHSSFPFPFLGATCSQIAIKQG